MSVSETVASEPSPGASSRRARRRFVPRFGLRTLLIGGFLFCLLFGWIGKNAYRMRQEEAALEALKRAHATIILRSAEGGLLRATSEYSVYDDWPRRLAGWRGPLQVSEVDLGSPFEFLPVDDAAMARASSALPTFSEIECVNLAGRRITDESLADFHRLSKLDEVSMYETKVTGVGLARLGQPLRIREVRIVRQGLSPNIGQLTSLRSLDLSYTSLSRADVAAIASLPELETLRLTYIDLVDEDAYARLADAASLRSLLISRAGVRDEDMAIFARMPALEYLSVKSPAGLGIKDAGLARLESSSTLRGVELDMSVTRSAAMKFSAAHPDCTVRHLYRPGGMYYRAGKIVEERDLAPEERWPWERSYP